MLLLFDTHVWVWNVEGEVRRIGRRARRLIALAESRESVRISPATVFEIASLFTMGRLGLARPLEQWFRNAIDSPGVRLVELSAAIAIDAGSIPRTALVDPVDRSPGRHRPSTQCDIPDTRRCDPPIRDDDAKCSRPRRRHMIIRT